MIIIMIVFLSLLSIPIRFHTSALDAMIYPWPPWWWISRETLHTRAMLTSFIYSNNALYSSHDNWHTSTIWYEILLYKTVCNVHCVSQYSSQQSTRLQNSIYVFLDPKTIFGIIFLSPKIFLPHDIDYIFEKRWKMWNKKYLQEH